VAAVKNLSIVFTIFFAAFMVCAPQVFAQQTTPAFSDVNKIFQVRCVKCHGGTRPPEGLYLDSYKGVMAGSKDMQVIVKGDPGKSELLKRIKGISKPRMPKDGPPWLSEDDIMLIEKWIAAGAPD
jgi:mono/diheme cytochrome c family protein